MSSIHLNPDGNKSSLIVIETNKNRGNAMTYEDKYNELIKIDDTGMLQNLYDIYVAISFLQNNTRIIKADDFSVACLLETVPKIVQKLKKILYQNKYINYNTEEKIRLIKENNIIADLSSIEILRAD